MKTRMMITAAFAAAALAASAFTAEAPKTKPAKPAGEAPSKVYATVEIAGSEDLTAFAMDYSRRIEAQQLTCGGDRRADRDGALVQLDAEGCALDELVERCGDAAARRVAQDANPAASAQQRLGHAVERRAVGEDLPLHEPRTAEHHGVP